MRNNRKIKNLINILLILTFVSVIAYISWPIISSAADSTSIDVENTVSKIESSVSNSQLKFKIREHRGLDQYNDSYADAKGTKGFSSYKGGVSSFISNRMENVKESTGTEDYYAWVNALKYNCSVFCQQSGTPLPGIGNRILKTFHLKPKPNTHHDGWKTADTKGVKYTDFIEHLKHDDWYECTGKNTLSLLPKEWTIEGVEPQYVKVDEYQFDWRGEGSSIAGANNNEDVSRGRYFIQHTLVTVDYKSSDAYFDPMQAYIFAFSNRAYYTSDPAQIANWIYKNKSSHTGTGRTLYNAAAAVTASLYGTVKPGPGQQDYGSIKIAKPKMSSKDAAGNDLKTGTIIDTKDNKSYKVGPIYMSDYTYAWSESVKGFSGLASTTFSSTENAQSNSSKYTDIIKEYDANELEFFKGLISGIIDMKIYLDGSDKPLTVDGKDIKIVYSKQDANRKSFSNSYYTSPGTSAYYYFPTPNSEFYIDIPISSCVGSTKIEKITATYKWTEMDGKHGDMSGTYHDLEWTGSKTLYGCDDSQYDCKNTIDGYECKTQDQTACYHTMNYYVHNFDCGITSYCNECSKHYGSPTTCDGGAWESKRDGTRGNGIHESSSTKCGYSYEHTHGTNCGNWTCGYTEGEYTCGYKTHTHDPEDCYHHCDNNTEDDTSDDCDEKCKKDGDLTCSKHVHKGCTKHYHKKTASNHSCCGLIEHTHTEWKNAGSPGCYKTKTFSGYCPHGFSGSEHDCGKESEHKGSSCGAENWGTKHIGKCYGEGDEGKGEQDVHEEPSRCVHGHAFCAKCVWECTDDNQFNAQKLTYVNWEEVYDLLTDCQIENIPLVAKVEVDKYIHEVKHTTTIGDYKNTYGPSDDRQKLKDDVKSASPVYVEFGDEVTYKLVFKNDSAFGVKIRIADELKDKDKMYFIEGTVNGKTLSTVQAFRSEELKLNAGETKTATVKLRVEALQGTYENLGKIITRNGDVKKEDSDDVDYVRTLDDDGPVVLHPAVECDGTINYPQIESRDYYTLNNYNTFVDKYVYKYDESRQKLNNSGKFTNEPTIVNADNTLIESRQNTNTATEQYDDPKDDFLVDTRRQDNGVQETKKAEHPLNVEKYEKITYAIKVSNEAKKVEGKIDSGDKFATQVRPTKVTDKMHKGLEYSALKNQGITATIYKSDGSVKQNSLGATCKKVGTEGDLNVYEITMDNKSILDPGDYVIFLLEATVIQSNMYLPSMENSAELTMITNVNNKADNDRDVTTRNISQHQITKEFVRMKDLVIAGKVWVDFNRDGLMNESATADQRDFYKVDTAGMKGGIVVNLYRLDSQSSDKATKVRTTKTDADGFFTFGRNQAMTYYQPFNNTVQYNKDTYYQRVDKASGKDGNGNYTDGSEYYRYYVEYEYDGVMYKSTEFYAGMKNLKQNDGRYETEYLIDSNAAELDEDREKFNKLYEYISYDVAYDLNMSTQNGGNLSFDKDGHISTLIENEARKMTAKSFVVKHDTSAILKACKTAMNSCGSAKWKQCSNHWDDWQVAISMGIIDESLYPNTTAGRKAAQAYLQSIYDSLSTSTSDDTQRIKYLWLYSFNGGVDNTIPETDYLKYINLGLELREDVDIALTKDVYSVKTTIDGEEVEYSLNQLDILNGEGSNRDYIIDKPYGLELYESDYKKRTDQYASQAVRDYKGTESELNVEVTYRMTLNNIPVRDDYKMSSSTDTKLFVKIHEILDLYDQNFMTYSNNNTVTVKTKNANGFLEDKTVKVSEAWYFKKGGSGTKYSISNADEVAKGAKPFYVEDPNGTYTKVALVVSNESSRGSGVFSNKANNFTADGYKTMYVRGMDGIVLAEGEELDIYVKYTLDKDTADVKVSSSYSETKSERSSSSINIDGNTLEFAVQGESSTSTNVQLHRALRIAEDDKDKKNGRGIENIAQINAYSVWYNKAATKPASIVDVDSNAGNIGVTNGEGSKNVGSADEISLYEDTAYKTGVEIAAENTENDPDDVNTRYGIRIITKLTDLTRKITGQVWDDSRTETLDTGSGNLYHGDGINESKKDSKKSKNGKAQSNILVDEGKYMNNLTEKVDIPVRNAKAEFVEIVQISADKYYEQVLTDVTWEQKQHDRTDKTGTYLLEGLTPGTYIVRFTYGDTVDAKEDGVEDVALANRDMQIFNGQDYKSTKYTMALENGQLNVDEVIRRFNQENTSDARDDEMRRLTVNKYSEVMTNEKAEILKGLVNNEIEGLGTRYGENPGVKNTPDDLKALTDNTYMEAETVEFTIKPEKLLAEAAYYRDATPEEIAEGEPKVVRQPYNDTNGIQVQKYTSKENDIYYNALEIVKNSDIYDRAFAIYNLDFGIEYRPESQISLTKEINQMKLTAEDGTVLVDLFFDTSKTTEGKTIHTINKEKSKGLEVVQFITNDYTNFAQALIKDIQNEEHTQGFVYIQVDDEILQGATVEITYKFYAQNNSEIDLIRDTLDVIRFKENKQTNELVKSKGPEILDTTYTASGTAENILFAEMYKEDGHGDLYRTKQKLLINTGTDEGYFGRFVGYSYYTGEKFARDVVACLKFDKILDYIDTNLEFKQETNNDLLENRFWTITNPTELKPYVYALRKGGVDLTPVGTLTNVEGQEYKALVVSVDDGLYDNMPDRIPDNAATLGNGIVNNKELSRFLLPEKADKTKDKTDSTGYIYLPTSKVIAAETDTDNLQYENIAEIVQFTTLTGRRTNFETTIGNANIHKAQRSEPSKGSPEFDTAALEPDTAATETITLTPPTGLMLSRRKIVNVVDVASKGVGITVIVAAVVAIVFGITTVTSLIIKKRRIK